MKRLNDNSKVLIMDLEQDSPDWLPWRQKGIGSSDVALLMSPEPVFDRTVGTLWKRKVGYEREVALDNEHIRRGKELEPKIRDEVNKILGTNFEPACVLREDAPYLRASLDGIDYDRDAILEIKAPSPKVFKKYKDTWEIPENYYLQMQYQMLCSDTEYGYFAFAQDSNPDDIPWLENLELYIIPVKNNHLLQLEIEKNCAIFQKGVDNKIPVGWKDDKLVLFESNPTMFVIIGGPEQMEKLYGVPNFPLPIVKTFYEQDVEIQGNQSFVVGIAEPMIVPFLKQNHPHHHLKIINLIDSPFANAVQNVELTKKGLLEAIKQLA